jgi:hypothetical protein
MASDPKRDTRPTFHFPVFAALLVLVPVFLAGFYLCQGVLTYRNMQDNSVLYWRVGSIGCGVGAASALIGALWVAFRSKRETED